MEGVILALVYVWIWYRNIVYREKLLDNFTLDSISQAFEYVFIWFQRYSGGILALFTPSHPLLSPMQVSPLKFVVVHCVVLSFCIFVFPPQVLSRRGFTRQSDAHAFLALQRNAPGLLPTYNKRKAKAAIKKLRQYILNGLSEKANKVAAKILSMISYKRQHFCIETACTLLEASYQAYSFENTDSHTKLEESEVFSLGVLEDHNQADSEAVKRSLFRERIRSLGLEVVEEFSSETQCTFGYIAAAVPFSSISRSGSSQKHQAAKGNAQASQDQLEVEVTDRLVVSFRGSVTQNILADLNVNQIRLPQLKESTRFFTDLLERSDEGGPPLHDSVDIDISFSGDTVDPPMPGLGQLADYYDDGNLVEKAFSGKTQSSEESPSRDSERASPPISPLDLPRKRSRREDQRTTLNSLTGDSEENRKSDKDGSNLDPENDREVSSWSLFDNFEAIGEDPTVVQAATCRSIEEGHPSNGARTSVQDPSLRRGMCGSLLHSISRVGSSCLSLGQTAYVHSGFWQAYESIRRPFLLSVFAYIRKHKAKKLEESSLSYSFLWNEETVDRAWKPLEISFCGHSLGAAMGE